MKHRLLIPISLLFLAASCTPKAQQPATLATATPDMVATAPTPAETTAPTATNTPDRNTCVDSFQHSQADSKTGADDH